ncbi:putative lipase ROG1 [Spathaspora sp. JA1]|nr:putative lipase ROG1 [Spathaspora sp. JA1]
MTDEANDSTTLPMLQIPIALTKDQLDSMEDRILYRQVKSVKAGQIERFKINFTPRLEGEAVAIPPTLWIKVKNSEPVPKRAVFLAGPYILYVDCRSTDYNPNQKCFITADQPVYEPQLLPGQSFYIQLSCHTLKPDYSWIIDIVSQIIFNNTISIDFEILIGTSKQILHEASYPERQILNSDKIGNFSPFLNINHWDTFDLWNLPVPKQDKPIHLVILSHGLHSNASVDMLYLKERIDQATSQDPDSNVIVKAFFGNIGKTERGIKYLGSRVAEYIIELITENETFNQGKVDKISFVGHSLGGCIQTFAIAYLKINFPWFFDQITPINFITLASPLLGVASENPSYVNLVLSAGFVGKTGQELGLRFFENDSKPLLLLLPSGPTHNVLKTFKRRTIYANAINDGIVPLRTSSLLYLDYKAISQIINEDEKSLNEGKKFDIQTMLSYFMPQTKSVYHKFQTSDQLTRDESVTEDQEEEEIGMIPPSTFMDSAASLILPPLPSLKYIIDPDSRENVIIHDKVYFKKKDIRREPPKSSSMLQEDSVSGLIKKKFLDKTDYSKFEQEIAQEYHKDMGWRKVIVKLKPDAHNNIIVRRRFANAYGWPVIQHLADNHFGPNRSSTNMNISNTNTSSTSTEEMDKSNDLRKVVSRELITKQNNEIDETVTEEEHAWINSKDNSESLFAVGVTGLLGEVTEMMGDIREQIYKYSSISPPISLSQFSSAISIVPPPSNSTRNDSQSDGEFNEE